MEANKPFQESDFIHAPAIIYDKSLRAFLTEKGLVSPNYVLVKVTKEANGAKPEWWGLDEVVGLLARRGGHESISPKNDAWRTVSVEHLHEIKGVFLDMGIGERLKIRDLPPAV